MRYGERGVGPVAPPRLTRQRFDRPGATVAPGNDVCRNYNPAMNISVQRAFLVIGFMRYIRLPQKRILVVTGI